MIFFRECGGRFSARDTAGIIEEFGGSVMNIQFVIAPYFHYEVWARAADDKMFKDINDEITKRKQSGTLY